MQQLKSAAQSPARVIQFQTRTRIEAIDLARGIAVALMILSHGVKGLLGFEAIPPWGMVPIHLVTKFASTLFIMVFGIALGVAFLPYVGTPLWPRKRNKLLLRGLVVLFWYKVLTIIEMMHTYPREDVIGALLYKGFPVYVEILGFYAIALLWMPFALPLWRALPFAARMASPLVLAVAAVVLHRHFDFWNIEPLKAIFVEHERHYTWGQLTRGPLVFGGLLLGEALLLARGDPRHRARLIATLAVTSVALLFLFWMRSSGDTYSTLMAIAKNEGKHPPESQFMIFSMSGALMILALSLAVTSLPGKWLKTALAPFFVIGKDALQSFVFHIFVIFVIYRYLLDYWRNVSYSHALALTAVLIVLTSLWIKGYHWVQERS